MPAEYNPEMQGLHLKIKETRKKLNELKRALAVGVVEDYDFKSAASSTRALSSLFDSHMDLIVIQNMGRSCKYCTLWADGLNGLVPHLNNRASLVLISPDPIELALEFAKGRNWNFSILSSEGTSFKKDLGYHSDEDGTLPGISTFRKKADGQIENIANDFFGPGDDYCPQWHILELLDGGPKGWVPEYSY